MSIHSHAPSFGLVSTMQETQKNGLQLGPGKQEGKGGELIQGAISKEEQEYE